MNLIAIICILILLTVLIISCCFIYNRNHTITKKRICIFMIVTPEIMDYARHTIESNRKYALLHGYDFKTFGDLTPDLPINFSKLQATIELMNFNYEYIVHIDADAMVINNTIELESIINKYLIPGVSFIAGEDCYDRTVCSKPGHINSGVYIVKNDLMGKEIMNLWLNSARTKCKQYTTQFPNCQLVFSHCVLNSIYRLFIRIIPYYIMNGKDGLFIQHMMQHTSRDRIDQFKQNKVTNKFLSGEERINVF